MAICMAQAYASSGDLGSARAELERLLAADTRDTRLLQQLSKLAEEEGDLETAARYQKQLNRAGPQRRRLVAAGAALRPQRRARGGRGRLVEDGLGQERAPPDLRGDRQPARPEETRSRCSRSPNRWCGKTRTTGRRSIARASRWSIDGSTTWPRERFQALLELTTSDDELSALARSRSKDPKLKAAEHAPSALRQTTGLPIEQRLAQVSMIRRATTLDNRTDPCQSDVAGGVGARRLRPGADGEPGLAGRHRREERQGAGRGIGRAGSQGGRKEPRRSSRALGLVLSQPAALRQRRRLAAGKLLSQAAPNDPLALWAYLYSVGGRERATGPARRLSTSTRAQQPKDTTPPLGRRSSTM